MLRIAGNSFKLYSKSSFPTSIVSNRRGVSNLIRTNEVKNGRKVNLMEKTMVATVFPKTFGSLTSQSRSYTTDAFLQDPANAYQIKMRNIGISAHIDSGKTTLTERILYYTGRIQEIHEVKGKDKVGATMDFMDLEREKGITIQSAATYCSWGDNKINIIDTPGHVDFTIEVERALRVLDGAVLVLCGVSGVQSQTLTVDRQMRRYSVPRLVFINKLDRMGADPYKVLGQLRSKLNLNAALLTIPIGIEHALAGVIDLITQEAVSFDGHNGVKITRGPVPPEYQKRVAEHRQTLLERLADGDDFIAEKVLDGVEPTVAEIKEAIKRSVLAHKFTPVLCGSALKNKGVQLLLDAVVEYLPNPMQSKNTALDVSKGEVQVELESDVKKPFVGLAFKLEEGRFGQLTYMRVYSGQIKRGEFLYNVNTGKKIKVPRLVRMHANSMEEIDEVSAGEICAMFGVDCASGNSFTNGSVQYTMTSMHIPEPVMSLAISTKKESSANFSKALAKFQKEDPTFRVVLDPESNQTIIKGMGELHLDIYIERMKREYGVEVTIGKPQVAYRETIGRKTEFVYTHKKQSGGAGQYAKVMGYVEPIPEEEKLEKEFVDATVGANIPVQFMPAIQKGYFEAMEKGPQIGVPVVGVRMVVTDGQAHPVDSNEIAFRTASVYGFREGFKDATPVILEPLMTVEITAPAEFQGTVMGGINKRKGVIQSTDTANDVVTVICEVPLNNMFGYSSDLRSCTQGKGEFVMEYSRHAPVPKDETQKLIVEFAKKREQEKKL